MAVVVLLRLDLAPLLSGELCLLKIYMISPLCLSAMNSKLWERNDLLRLRGLLDLPTTVLFLKDELSQTNESIDLGCGGRCSSGIGLPALYYLFMSRDALPLRCVLGFFLVC